MYMKKTMINLSRPIIFLDIESTGLDRENDRIIEFATCKLMPDGNTEVKAYLLNPGIPIPEASTAIHGITNEKVKGCPTFSQIAKSLLAYLEGCDIGGFNSNMFDLPMLFNEFSRSGLYWDYTKCQLIDVGNIFKIKQPRTLEAAVSIYLNRVHEGAHGAQADACATAEVFLEQLKQHEDLKNMSVPELARFSNYDKQMLDLSGKFVMDDQGNVLLNFGKYRGEKAIDHLDFLDWMINRASFAEDTVQVAVSVIESQSLSGEDLL